MVALVALFTLIQGGLAVLSMHEQEDELVDDLVIAETRRLATRLEHSGTAMLFDEKHVLLPDNYEAWWVGRDGQSIPEQLPESMRPLSDGPHLDSAPGDEQDLRTRRQGVRREHLGGISGAEYHIMVMPAAGGRLFVRYNAVRNEAKVRAFAVQVFMLALFFIATAAWIAHHLAGSLIAPLQKVARLLDHWAPASEPGSTLVIDEEHRVLDAFRRVQVRWERGLARESERLADIHHEIRTPLSALRTDLEMLQGLDLRSGTESVAASAGQSLLSQRLQRSLAMIDAIAGALESLRALRMGEPAQAECVQLVGCVDDAWASLGELPTEHGLTLSNEVDPQASALVDRQALMAILRNLFRNAAEHAAPATLSVRYADEQMEVADDGPGIPAEEMPFVFERYYCGQRADEPDVPQATPPDNEYARGLGLAIARQVAEANGWYLTVGAARPKGTHFTISFK